MGELRYFPSPFANPRTIQDTLIAMEARAYYELKRTIEQFPSEYYTLELLIKQAQEVQRLGDLVERAEGGDCGTPD